jgi:hypothetical protein
MDLRGTLCSVGTSEPPTGCCSSTPGDQLTGLGTLECLAPDLGRLGCQDKNAVLNEPFTEEVLTLVSHYLGSSI